MNPTSNVNTTLIESDDFKRLVKKRWRVSILLTVAILVIYIGFLLVVAFNKNLLAIKIGNFLAWAMPIGLGIIVSAWVLTGIYVFWANSTYDNEVQQLKNKLKN